MKLVDNGEKDIKTTWVDVLFPEAKDGSTAKKFKENNSGVTVEDDADIKCNKKWKEVKNKKKTKLPGKNKEVSCKKVGAKKENKIDHNKTTMVYKEIEKGGSHKNESVTKKKRSLTKVTCLHMLQSEIQGTF